MKEKRIMVSEMVRLLPFETPRARNLGIIGLYCFLVLLLFGCSGETSKYNRMAMLNQMPLTKDEVLFEYRVCDYSTYLWVVDQKGVAKFIKIPISKEKLTKIVEDFGMAFEEYLYQKDSYEKNRSQQLYNLLLKEALGGINASKLIIVPDGVLHQIPFETLIGEDGYLLDHYEISYYLSATSFALNRLFAGPMEWTYPLFAVGDPIYDAHDKRLKRDNIHDSKSSKYEVSLCRLVPEEYQFHPHLMRLPTARKEVLNIGRLWNLEENSSHLLLGLAANEENVKTRKLNSYRYLHFATYCVVPNSFPLVKEPTLILSLVGNREEDGYLTESEISELKLDADLVTLSAGRSITLVNAFLSAGARSVVATLWDVEDNSTYLLMKKFYYYLKQGKDKAKAQTLAKRDLRQMPQCSHPFFWAPFILVGGR